MMTAGKPEAMALGVCEGVDAHVLYDVITHSAGNSAVIKIFPGIELPQKSALNPRKSLRKAASGLCSPAPRTFRRQF